VKELKVESLLHHNACHLGKSKDWIFGLSMATRRHTHIWCNMLSCICQIIGHHFKPTVDLLVVDVLVKSNLLCSGCRRCQTSSICTTSTPAVRAPGCWGPVAPSSPAFPSPTQPWCPRCSVYWDNNCSLTLSSPASSGHKQNKVYTDFLWFLG